MKFFSITATSINYSFVFDGRKIQLSTKDCIPLGVKVVSGLNEMLDVERKVQFLLLQNGVVYGTNDFKNLDDYYLFIKSLNKCKNTNLCGITLNDCFLTLNGCLLN